MRIIISFGITVGCNARLKIPSLHGIEPKSIYEECRVFASSIQKLSYASFYVILEQSQEI